jgi:glycerol-3-phosphate dehydrogenase
VRAAADAGATVVNHAEVKALRTVGGRVTGAEVACFDGSLVEVSARTVVNATGPWVDELRRLEDPAAAPTVRLSKGVHVLLALDEPWAAAVTVPQDAVRVSFAIPWQGMLLLGTTDTPHEGPPSEIGAGEADVAQVLAEAAIAVEPGLLRPQAVRSTFAGLRVLPLGDGETATARRETVFHRGGHGMLTVAGGKLTTYRHIALTALSLLHAELGLHRIETRPVPLPGAADPNLVARALNRAWPQLDAATASHLAGLYGNHAHEVLAPAVGDPELLRPLHPAGPDVVAQAVYARDHEWARIPDDILRGRTTVAARGLADAATVARIERLLEHSPSTGDSSGTTYAARTAPFRL